MRQEYLPQKVIDEDHTQFLASAQHAVPVGSFLFFPFGALEGPVVVMLCSPVAVQADSWRASP